MTACVDNVLSNPPVWKTKLPAVDSMLSDGFIFKLWASITSTNLSNFKAYW